MNASIDIPPSELTEMRGRYPEQVVSLNGSVWRLRDTGDGGETPLLMLPGALGTGDIHYRLMLRFASRGLRALVVTPPAGDDAGLLASGLAGLLDTLRLERVDVYGSSIGGYLVQIFGLSYPSRVRLMFIGNSFCDPTISQSKHPALSELREQQPEERLEATRRRLEAEPAGTPDRTELKRALLAMVGTQQSAGDLHSRIVCLAGAKPIDRVPLPSCDVIVVDSDEDPTVSIEQRHQVRWRYSRSRHYAIDGGGHYPSVLRADELAENMASEIFKADARAG